MDSKAEILNYISEIFYSESMKKLYHISSPIAGFPNAAKAAVVLRIYASYVAQSNHLDCDYVELLALLYFFEETEFEHMLQKEPLKTDFKLLKQSDSKHMSKEVRCVWRVIQVLESVQMLSKEEIEKRGGRVICESALMDEIRV